MTEQERYKSRIEDILIKEKRYRAPKFSAQKLAEELGVPTYKLSRILKATYGMTYTDIVHTYRIQDAMHHLQDRRLTPYSVDDIGSMVGFNNRQSFFDAFKKVAGMTPDRFRNTTA